MSRKKIVLASGAFDLLHWGHVMYLEEAKKAGGEKAELIVIVARDATIEKTKGKKPVIPEDQRRSLVEALRMVDEAILGYEELEIGKVIEKIRPDVIAIGYDQSNIEEEVRRVVKEKELSVQIVKVGKFGRDNMNSSSKIKRKIVDSWI